VPDKLISNKTLRKKHCTKKSAGPRVKPANKENKPSNDANVKAPKKNKMGDVGSPRLFRFGF
jgi:hypothetical protein